MKLASVLVVSALACGSAFAAADAAKGGKEAGGPSDPQIAGIVVAANTPLIDC